MDYDSYDMQNLRHEVIETTPPGHVYTGGMICNLQNPESPLTPDYICGELMWDGSFHTLNWYHYSVDRWIRTDISTESGIAVGMATADLTGNGTLDIVAAEWPLGPDAVENEGHVYWFEQPEHPFEEIWTRHVLADGWDKAHDLHIGTINGRGRSDRTGESGASINKNDVLVRLKDGRISWYESNDDPRDPWSETVVAYEHPGDGTALYDVTGNGGQDVVTGSGFFENVDGHGKSWRFHPFEEAKEMQLDPETRVVVGDCARNGSVTVIITESEILENARVVALTSSDSGETWDTRILIDKERNLGALHSLQLLDINGDGALDIFTAEMELYREDVDILRRPTWKAFINRSSGDGHLEFEEHTVLDANLGAHMGCAGRISREGRTEYIAKNWLANAGNGWDGNNHIVHVF